MAFPGFLSRFEPATGLLVRGILVNGHYLLTDTCQVFPQQEIDLNWLIQGGSGGSIANLGRKHIEGQISCPIRVDQNGNLEQAVQEILNNAQFPNTPLRIDTNHVLSDLRTTADNGGTDNNLLLSMDCLVVKDLTVTATPNEGVKLTATVIGMIDSRTSTDLITSPDGHYLGRTISWAECDAERFQSSMRSVVKIVASINNQVEIPTFLLPYTASINSRSDQPTFVGVKQCKWGGNFEEFLRLGNDKETYIHGGWMVGENLVFTFGPIKAIYPVPLFKISQQPLTYNILKRNTEFFFQNSPNYAYQQGGLFTF